MKTQGWIIKWKCVSFSSGILQLLIQLCVSQLACLAIYRFTFLSTFTFPDEDWPTWWNTETKLWHQNSFPGKACTGAGVRCTEGISYSITTFRALLLTNLGGAYLEPEWDSCSGTAENNNLDSFAGRSPCGFGVSCFFCQIVKFDYPKCSDLQK